MQKLDLQRMMTEAKADSKAIEKLKGDWRTQIQMLNRTVSVVTTYQKAINKALGTPYFGRAFRTSNLPEGVMALEEFRRAGEIHFNGAALVQTLEVVHENKTLVNYNATLKVDENYFLGQMLPQVQRLRNADPDYIIYDLAIEVPHGELVAESLQMLNDRINGVTEEVPQTETEAPFLFGPAVADILGSMIMGNARNMAVGNVPVFGGAMPDPNQATRPKVPRFLP